MSQIDAEIPPRMKETMNEISAGHQYAGLEDRD